MENNTYKNLAVVFDVDGIFTDSYHFYDIDGKTQKGFDSYHREFINFLKYLKIDVYFITGDVSENGSAITKARFKDLGLEEDLVFCQADKKIDFFMSLPYNKIYYIADDLLDQSIFSLDNVVGITHDKANSILQSKAEVVFKTPISAYLPELFPIDDYIKYINNKTFGNVSESSIYANRNTAILQIYSGRSRDTGLYDLTKDGNFFSTLCMINETLKKEEDFRARSSNKDFKKSKFYISIPLRSQLEETSYNHILEMNHQIFNDRIEFIEIPYYSNAKENREKSEYLLKEFFIKLKDISRSLDNLVMDFPISNPEKYSNMDIKNYIYFWSISPDLETTSKYIEHCKEDFNKVILEVEALRSSWDSSKSYNKFIFVPTIRQQEYILDFSSLLVSRSRSLTKEKTSVSDFDFKTLEFVYKLSHFFNLQKENEKETLNVENNKFVFCPFRLTDSSYSILEILELMAMLGLNISRFPLVITDPNNSRKSNPEIYEDIIEKAEENNIEIILEEGLSKQKYYEYLKKSPIIILLDDPNFVYHFSVAEFVAFNCSIITKENPYFENTLQCIGLS